MDTRGGRLRQLRSALYRLKRAYGVPVTIHTATAAAVDVTTGVKTVTRSAVRVARAVVLPEGVKKEFKYDIGYLRANSNFTYGALYTEGTRELLIDRHDLPRDFAITVTDATYVVYRHTRYAIKRVEAAEVPYYYLVIQELKGQPAGEVHEVRLFDRHGFTETFTGGRG